MSQREIDVFDPQAWDSRRRRASWQVYFRSFLALHSGVKRISHRKNLSTSRDRNFLHGHWINQNFSKTSFFTVTNQILKLVKFWKSSGQQLEHVFQFLYNISPLLKWLKIVTTYGIHFLKVHFRRVLMVTSSRLRRTRSTRLWRLFCRSRLVTGLVVERHLNYSMTF